MKQLFTILLLFAVQLCSAQILTQQISPHPIFPDVERHVDVTLQQANSDAHKFEFWFKVRYIRDSVDISYAFQQPSRTSVFTDATTRQLLRDSLFQPIPSLSWDSISTDPYDQYQWMYGWDMIMIVINRPTNITNMIRQYIIINDEEQFFDN